MWILFVLFNPWPCHLSPGCGASCVRLPPRLRGGCGGTAVAAAAAAADGGAGKAQTDLEKKV